MKIDPSPDPTVIRAAGGVVWQRGGGKPRLCIIHRPKYQDWSLPKGKLKAGETWLGAARREVREETGCEVKIGDFAGCISYLVNGRPKVVLFWNMERVGDCTFQLGKEVDRLEWVTPADAVRRLDQPGERGLLGVAAKSAR